MPTDPNQKDPELPTKPDDSSSPREVVNPGDPGPTVLVPPTQEDPRLDPKLPAQPAKPPPGI